MGTTFWNDSYPSGGNYWNNWTGPDTKKGPDQDQPGSDGIVDHPYLISGGKNASDRYPLVKPPVLPPYVLSTSPNNEATNVSLDTKIVIEFTEAMNRSTVERAITASPSIAWTASWSKGDMEITLTPTVNLAFGTNYSISISRTAKSVHWFSLSAKYQFWFSTPFHPNVIAVSPLNGSKNISLATTITIRFDQPMNRTSTESAISSAPSIIGSFTWDSASEKVDWHPDTNLSRNTKYDIMISTGAKSKFNASLSQPFVFSFTTEQPVEFPAPSVMNTDPKNGSTNISLNATILIEFTRPMDVTATQNAISIAPDSPWTTTWKNNDTIIELTSSVALKPLTSYTITISKDAKSKDGVHLKNQYVFSFTTIPVITPPVKPPQTSIPVMPALVIGLAGTTIILASVALCFGFEWILYSAVLSFLLLYTRITKEKILNNFLRGRIFEFVRQHPGAHLRFIKKELALEMGVLCYHLKILEDAGIVTSENNGLLKRFSVSPRNNNHNVSHLTPSQKRIMKILTSHPGGLRVKTLSKMMKRSRQEIIYNILMLYEKGKIESQSSWDGVRYFIPENKDR